MTYPAHTTALLRRVHNTFNRNEKRRYAAAAIAWIVALVITGTMDYADAKKQEAVICKRQPTPEFCK